MPETFVLNHPLQKITISDELKSLIQSYDLKVVNFEVPLKPEVKLSPQRRERFFQNDDAPDFLRSLGFNLFSQANNHAFDWWCDEGFKKTKAALGDAALGAGTYEEAYRVKVMEMKGVIIVFLKPQFGTSTKDHPDTHVVFKDFEIPYYKEAERMAKELHKRLYRCHSVEWDIAITEKGPMFIEGNGFWEISLIQAVHGGMKTSWKILF